MEAGDVHQIVTASILTVLTASGPILIVALIVGFGIALFQALTSVQEMTLTFVPKVAAIFIVLGLSLPFMFSAINDLTDQVFNLIIHNGF